MECVYVSLLSIGIGIGLVILVFLRCVLFHGDPVSCLRCLASQLILSFLFFFFLEEDETSKSPASVIFPSCNCTKPPENPEQYHAVEVHAGSTPDQPLKEEKEKEKEEKEKLSGQEVEMVMRSLGMSGVTDTLPVGAGEIESLFEEQEPSLGEVKEAFDVFDKNCDGFIDPDELRDVLSALGLDQISKADCVKLIRAFDENKDGRIDFREFVKLVEKSFCFS